MRFVRETNEGEEEAHDACERGGRERRGHEPQTDYEVLRGYEPQRGYEVMNLRALMRL